MAWSQSSFFGEINDLKTHGIIWKTSSSPNEKKKKSYVMKSWHFGDEVFTGQPQHIFIRSTLYAEATAHDLTPCCSALQQIQPQSIHASDIPAPQQPPNPPQPPSWFSSVRDKVLSDRRDHNHWRERERERRGTQERIVNSVRPCCLLH